MPNRIPYKKPYKSAKDLVRLRIYFNLCTIKWFLDCISPNNTLKNKICKLLGEYPCIDISAMGFPADWLQEELWKG